MSIFPRTSDGGVIVRTSTGTAVTTPGTSTPETYVPGVGFTMTCDQTAFNDNNCPNVPEEHVLNALAGEILALAEAFNSAGLWDCNAVGNLAANFAAWRDGNHVGSLGYVIAQALLPSADAGNIYAIGSDGHPFVPPNVVTSLTYANLTSTLTFTDETGATHNLDLSGLAIDMNATGATYNSTTGILTVTGDDGMASVTVDLSALKAVNVTNSITGNGDTSSLQLVNDQASPGASMLYGTSAAGVKGWFSTPLPSITTPAANSTVGSVGTNTARFALADHVHAETVTSLNYSATTKFLTFTDESGAANVLDLSGLAIDMNATGATYNSTTGILTVTGDDGMASVTVDLSALKAVNVTNSITGNGDTSSLQFVNDQASPGASMLYGTSAAGVKGWFSQPSGTVTASNSITGNGVGSSLQLVNDIAAPGASMLYGTSPAGVKGWFSQPSGGSTVNLSYNAGTHILTLTDQSGGSHNVDLSGLAIDMNATGATYNATTGVLTVTGDDGMASVTVDLSALKAVNVTNSITGNGDTSSLQLSGDVAAPGATMLYGTNAAGTKGWYAQPSSSGLTAATLATTAAGTGVGAFYQWADQGSGSPTRGQVGTSAANGFVTWPVPVGTIVSIGAVNGAQYTCLGQTTSGFMAVRTA